MATTFGDKQGIRKLKEGKGHMTRLIGIKSERQKRRSLKEGQHRLCYILKHLPPERLDNAFQVLAVVESFLDDKRPLSPEPEQLAIEIGGQADGHLVIHCHGMKYLPLSPEQSEMITEEARTIMGHLTELAQKSAAISKRLRQSAKSPESFAKKPERYGKR